MDDDYPKGSWRGTFADGEGWVVFGPLSGRDFLDVRDVWARRDQPTDDDVEKLVRLAQRRVIAASSDVLELPLGEVLDLVFQYYWRLEEAAVPPATGTD